MAKTCQVCGKPSGMYPICPACFKLRDAGEVVKCEKCGVWHKTAEPCKCSNEIVSAKTEIPSPKTPTIEKTNARKCLLCDNDAGDNHFCPSCYKKHKDHCIIISIKNCRDTEIIEKYAEGIIYVCQDGHQVRSKSEMLIDDFLYNHKIMHCYEYAFPVDMEKTIYPDFYLPDLDVYIEHFGINNSEKYAKEKKYKLDIYREKGVTIICTNENDMQRPEFSLKKKLDYRKEGQINFEE